MKDLVQIPSEFIGLVISLYMLLEDSGGEVFALKDLFKVPAEILGFHFELFAKFLFLDHLVFRGVSQQPH